jgi:hypothetical protein
VTPQPAGSARRAKKRCSPHASARPRAWRMSRSRAASRTSVASPPATEPASGRLRRRRGRAGGAERALLATRGGALRRPERGDHEVKFREQRRLPRHTRSRSAP